jgi:phosphoadenosine phosphosulfate reductase
MTAMAPLDRLAWTEAASEAGLGRDGATLEALRKLDSRALLETAIRRVFPGRIALVSSFGAESAVLLDMVARIDPATPVIFLNTGKLFGETLRYRDRLVKTLGLSDIREVRPHAEAIAAEDPDGVLWAERPDRCCFLRKVVPLNRALEGFDAWISGRKRFHGGGRSAVPTVDLVDGRIKVEPLAPWSKQDLEDYFAAAPHLPRHPLEADGFLSIGCMPCTSRVAPGEGVRDGRWRDRDKTECGIHLPAGMTGSALP